MNAALSTGEECADIAIRREADDDALSEVGMTHPCAGREILGTVVNSFALRHQLILG
jgi:hypothetical protein